APHRGALVEEPTLDRMGVPRGSPHGVAAGIARAGAHEHRETRRGGSTAGDGQSETYGDRAACWGSRSVPLRSHRRPAPRRSHPRLRARAPELGPGSEAWSTLDDAASGRLG